MEVCETPMCGTEKKLITLQPGQQKTVRFGANTKAIFKNNNEKQADVKLKVTGDTRLTMGCLLYTSPSPRDRTRSRMPSSA